jgi:Toprim-like/Protein of unknown function (DUF3991)
LSPFPACRWRSVGGKGSSRRGSPLQVLSVVNRALASSDLRGSGDGKPILLRRRRKGGCSATEKTMERKRIEALRAKVSCEAVLEYAGYEIDLKESTRRAVKYRRGGEIIIVIHDGSGWFNPLGDEKGDTFRLAMFLDRLSFPQAVRQVAALVGFELSRPEWVKPQRRTTLPSLRDRWSARHVPEPGSGTWRYLCWTRAVPTEIIGCAIRQGILREGPFGSMWAAHCDVFGAILGWEERGPDWRGFATGGSKSLFRFGSADARRICVTEAAIDAMSLAAIEGVREGTLYLSTGGGWSPATDAALVVLASAPGMKFVAATDNNSQGEAYADRLRTIAAAAGCDWKRLAPSADDWNEVLQDREKQRSERQERGKKRPAACVPAASREALPGRSRPLTRPDTRPAAWKRS